MELNVHQGMCTNIGSYTDAILICHNLCLSYLWFAFQKISNYHTKLLKLHSFFQKSKTRLYKTWTPHLDPPFLVEYNRNGVQINSKQEFRWFASNIIQYCAKVMQTNFDENSLATKFWRYFAAFSRHLLFQPCEFSSENSLHVVLRRKFSSDNSLFLIFRCEFSSKISSFSSIVALKFSRKVHRD